MNESNLGFGVRDSGFARIKNYSDLDVWKLGISLAKDIYLLTKELPRDEVYGLVSQMRRAAVSISSNIAEGHRRQYPKEFVQFLHQALGSLAELETQLVLTNEIYKLKVSSDTLETMDALGRKLRRLIQSLKFSDEPRTPNPESQIEQKEVQYD